MAKQATTPATTPATPALPVTAQANNGTLYQFGKPYNVRPNTQNNNAPLWQAIGGAMQANGGTITYGALWALCNQHNNGAFAKYTTGRGYLVPVKQA